MEYSDGRVLAYEYDPLGRLSKLVVLENGIETSREEFAYDAVSNLQTHNNGDLVQFSYDDNDRLNSAGEFTYSYDAEGNMLTRTSATSFETFEYNELQQLVRYTKTEQGDLTVVEYAYDSDGLLVARTVDGEVSYYVWDRSSEVQPFLFEVRDSNQDVIRRYFNDGLSYIALESGGQTFALVTDVRGSVVGFLTDQSFVSQDFSGFGTATSPLEIEIGFGGGLFDDISGLVYFVSRWYDSSSGRFTQTDDAPGDNFDTRVLNRYIYSLGDPVNRVDPLGQESGTLQEKLVVFAVQGVVASIGAVTVASGGAEWLIRKISGNRVNFLDENITGQTRPFFEIAGTISRGGRRGLARYASANAGFFVGANVGLEFVSLTNGATNRGSGLGSLYIYFGVNAGLAFSVSASTSEAQSGASGGGSIGANFRTAVGDVFDTPTYDDYNGIFISVVGGFTFSFSTSRSITRRVGRDLGFGFGNIRQLSWSPTPGSTGTYSHSRVDFRAGGGANVADNKKDAVSFSATLKFGFGASYYLRIIDV